MGHGLQVAGVSGLSVGRIVEELYGIALHTAFPNLVLEALGAAVQVVGAVVDGQRVFHPVQGELALGDAVGESAGHLSGAGAVGKIIVGILIADHDVFQLAVPVRDHDGDDARPHAA